jgi:uncharacterized phage protein (TIGR02220 family)
MEGIDIWTKFASESAGFFTNKETIEEFKNRMEAKGFSLSWQDPQQRFEWDDVLGCLNQPITDFQFVEEVVIYLNVEAGTAFRVKVPSANATTILARRKEGYAIQDFKTVIHKKTAEWKGTEFERHLNPGTLFARKHFDNYLGQKTAHAQPTGQKTNFDKLNESLDKAKGRL